VSEVCLSNVWYDGREGRETEVDGRLGGTATGSDRRVGKAGRPESLPGLVRRSAATLSKNDSVRSVFEAIGASASSCEPSIDGPFPIRRGAGGFGTKRGAVFTGTGLFVDVPSAPSGPASFAAAVAAPTCEGLPEVVFPLSRPCTAGNVDNETEADDVDLFRGLMGVRLVSGRVSLFT